MLSGGTEVITRIGIHHVGQVVDSRQHTYRYVSICTIEKL